MGWATFLVIFSQTHLVALVLASMKTNDRDVNYSNQDMCCSTVQSWLMLHMYIIPDVSLKGFIMGRQSLKITKLLFKTLFTFSGRHELWTKAGIKPLIQLHLCCPWLLNIQGPMLDLFPPKKFGLKSQNTDNYAEKHYHYVYYVLQICFQNWRKPAKTRENSDHNIGPRMTESYSFSMMLNGLGLGLKTGSLKNRVDAQPAPSSSAARPRLARFRRI
jgi:hypothetical protein